MTGMGANDLLRGAPDSRSRPREPQGGRTLLKDADPKAVPVNALRRAIRRARSGGKQKQLIEYLEAYRRFLPEDGWAKKLQNETQRNAVSNYQLGKTGFPFPKMRPDAGVRGRGPQGLLPAAQLPAAQLGGLRHAYPRSALRAEPHRPGCRRGDPTGLPLRHAREGRVARLPLHDVVGNVDYRRLLKSREIEKKNPLFHYTERYLSALLTLPRNSARRSSTRHPITGTVSPRSRPPVSSASPRSIRVRGLWEVTRGSRNPEWAESNMFKYIARMEADAAKGATRVFAITEALREEMIKRGVDGDKIEDRTQRGGHLKVQPRFLGMRSSPPSSASPARP